MFLKKLTDRQKVVAFKCFLGIAIVNYLIGVYLYSQIDVLCEDWFSLYVLPLIYVTVTLVMTYRCAALNKYPWLQKWLVRISLAILIFFLLFLLLLGVLFASREAGAEASMKQTMANIRSLAEIYYNQKNNNYAYEGVCQDDRVVSMLDVISEYLEAEPYSVYANSSQREKEVVFDVNNSDLSRIQCVDDVAEYQITIPLPWVRKCECCTFFGCKPCSDRKYIAKEKDPEVFWCVDSAGFSGQLSELERPADGQLLCKE